MEPAPGAPRGSQTVTTADIRQANECSLTSQFMLKATIEHAGMRSEARATVRPLCRDIEGVPLELSEHLHRAMQAAAGHDLLAELTVLGMAQAGGVADLTLSTTGTAARATVSDWWGTRGERPDWLTPVISGRPPQRSGWIHRNEAYEREGLPITAPSDLRANVEILMSLALESLGMFPPWMWYLQVSLIPTAPGPRRLIDLRALDRRPHPQIRFPGCNAEGAIAHALDECDVHTACAKLSHTADRPRRPHIGGSEHTIGSEDAKGWTAPADSGSCAGCPGVGELLHPPSPRHC